MSNSSDDGYGANFVEDASKITEEDENVNDKLVFRGQTDVTDEIENSLSEGTENDEERLYDVKNKVILRQYVLKK